MNVMMLYKKDDLPKKVIQYYAEKVCPNQKGKEFRKMVKKYRSSAQDYLTGRFLPDCHAADQIERESKRVIIRYKLDH